MTLQMQRAARIRGAAVQWRIQLAVDRPPGFRANCNDKQKY
jgi:hypothetical protein